MEGFVFKLYFDGEREFFEFGEKAVCRTRRRPQITRRNFPMMESLLTFLDLDVMADDRMFREMEEAVKRYSLKRDFDSYAAVRTRLDELARKHIFYEALRLDWYDRLARAEDAPDDRAFDKIARSKTLRHTPSNLYAKQQHIAELFENVLRYGSGKESIRERAARYFTEKKERARKIDYYQFGRLNMICEPVSSSVFTEVLYADGIYDVLDYCVRACIMEEYPARRCKNCGKWFILTGHQGLEYCNRPFDDKGHTCRDVGAGLTWEKRSRDDKPFMAYRKEYKKRFARIKAGRITNEEFLAWGKRARAQKRACDEDKITLDEFIEWLENS
jgi:hypothetical protein